MSPHGTSSSWEIIMTKDHRRGNREVRKPKKSKEAVPALMALVKDAAASQTPAKKVKHGHEYSHH
jgi:hypothetical protein